MMLYILSYLFWYSVADLNEDKYTMKLPSNESFMSMWVEMYVRIATNQYYQTPSNLSIYEYVYVSVVTICLLTHTHTHTSNSGWK